MRCALTLATIALVATPGHASTGVVAEAYGAATAVEPTRAYVVAICEAHANVGAITTQVTCSLGDDAIVTTTTAPANVAVAVVAGYVPRPAYVCHTAVATYLDGSTSEAARTCVRFTT